MTRLPSALVRGAALLLGVSGLAGCMYITPSTGVCLTSVCQDFDKQREAVRAAASQPTPEPPKVYDTAADFKLVAIAAWGLLLRPVPGPDGQPTMVPRIDQPLDPQGLVMWRVAFGRPLQLENGSTVSESISVFTINGLPTGPESEAEVKGTVAALQRRLMADQVAPEPTVQEAPAKLGDKEAYEVSMLGRALVPDPAPAASPGATVPGPQIRMVSRSAIHRGRGYVVLITTVEELYSRLKAGYDGLFEGFTFKDADPVYQAPPAAPSGAPSGAPSAAPSGGPSAAPSGGPSAAPSAGASAAPSAAPSAGPSALPSAAASATVAGPGT